jgi:hypothetical protein
MARNARTTENAAGGGAPPRLSSILARLALAAFGISCVLSFLAPAAGAAPPGPLDAIALAGRGIEQADADLFNQAVDLDAVLDRAFGVLSAALRDQPVGEKNAAIAALAAAATGNAAQDAFVKQIILSEMKSCVAAGINGGYFAGRPNGRITPGGGYLSLLLPELSQERRELIPGKVLSREGDKAVASAVLVDAGSGRFPLTLALERRGGDWRVTEVVNAAQLLREAKSRGR